MPTYYEILKVNHTASVQELQTAIDDKYTQCRRLVTHYDPSVVNQANVALQSLEKIRETLLSPELKSIYDEALGFSGSQLGGLMDPDMHVSQLPGTTAVFPSMAVGRPVQQPVAPVNPLTSSAPVDGWHCEKCKEVNPVGSSYCKSCGADLGQPCPQCGTPYEITSKFCPSCGINPREFIEEQERVQAENLELRRQEVRLVLTKAESQLQAGMYGLGKDTLGLFAGLGNKSKNDQTIYDQNEPDWRKAEALDKNTNVVRTSMIKQNVLKIVLGYAVVGGVLGFVVGIIELINYFDWSRLVLPFGYAIGAGLVWAIVGATGSAVYYYNWGGRKPMQQELVFGALAPIGLAAALAVGAALIWVIIIVAVVVFAFMIWAGGG